MFFLSSPGLDIEHSRSHHHWFQSVERGMLPVLQHVHSVSDVSVTVSSSSDPFICSGLQYFPRVLGELSELQEIYDTDTVELVNWIRYDFKWKIIL